MSTESTKTRLYSLSIVLLCLTIPHLSYSQVGAGSTLRYDNKGAPDPLTGCWFQSIGEGEVSIHYDTVKVPSKVEGKLLSPAFMIDWDISMKYEMVNTIGSVRLIPNVRAILFSLKDDLSEAKGLLFDQDARRWYLFEETRVLLSNADIPQDETNKYARILSPENEGYHNSLLSAAGVTADWKNTCQTLESSFAKCVLRRDLYGKLVLGLVTEPKSKVYLPPIIANISPEVFGEFIPEALYDLRQIPEKVKLRPWPFNSSTDISVSNGPANSLVAEGQIEFLILGWNMCLPNFGKGTRINVQKGTQGMILMDATGNGVKVDDEGVYTYDGNHWKRVTEKK